MDGMMKDGEKKGEVESLRPLRSMVMGLGVSIAALLVVAGCILWYGVNKLGWTGGPFDAMLRAVASPAARVNGVAIPMTDFTEDIATLQHFYAALAAQADPSQPAPPMPSEEEMRTNVLDRLILNELLRQEASARGLSVTAEEIDREFESMVAASGGVAAVEADLQEMYGWQPDQFKRKVMTPFLLQTKLDNALKLENEADAAALARIQAAKDRLAAGEEFAEVARDVSTDRGSAAAGGQLGWFGPGIMVPEFEAAAFALEIGTVSEPVKSQFGYHLILVHEREMGEDDAVAKVNASHILIGFETAEEYLARKLAESDVKKYVE